MASLWGGRFEKDMDDIVKKYNASIFFDQRMYNEDIDGSIAHVTMLGRQGIISQQDVDDIHKGLHSILDDLHSGATIYEAIGAYNFEKHNEIITIVDKNEYQKLMNFINREDPKAFVTIYNVSSMHYQPKR